MHGNLPALKAMLVKIRQEQVDDIALGGTCFQRRSRVAAVHRRFELDIPVQLILGNGESEVHAQLLAFRLRSILL
jgi:hypothetical protein